MRFDDLGHIFATLALENGMDVKTRSAMLGHVSAATTLDTYTHVTGDMQKGAAEKIGGFMQTAVQGDTVRNGGIKKRRPRDETMSLGVILPVARKTPSFFVQTR